MPWLRRDCICGHPRTLHNRLGWGECTFPGCWCLWFERRPRRRAAWSPRALAFRRWARRL